MRSADLIDELESRGGFARAGTLQRAGFRRRELAGAVDSGAVLRVRKGVYCSPRTTPDLITAARHGGEAACASALGIHGIWLLDKPAAVHVWLGRKGRRHSHSRCRCTDHHDEGSATFGVVSVRRALVQAAVCLSDECFFAAFESAWRKRLVSRKDRRWIRDRVPRGMRLLIDMARGDADSGIESIFRLRLARIGISLESQVVIGGVGRVDFRHGRLLFEIDGRENHDGYSLRHKDLVRDATAAALGYETLRFDYAQIIYDWARVEAAVMARIRAHGVRSAGRSEAAVASMG